jgi:competence protein ComEA
MSVKRFVAASLVAVLAFAMSAGVATAAPKAQKAQAPAGKVNINTATAAQLAELPGIGEKTAARIVEHRQKEGPFKTTQELMNVKGIGEKNLQKLEPYLTLGEPARGAAR